MSTLLGSGQSLEQGLARSQQQLEEITKFIRRRITVLWQTALIRSVRPRIEDEILTGLQYHEATLIDVIPRLNREIADRLDTERAVVRPGSWIGGDRDGNPNVTDEVVTMASRRAAATVLGHYLRELRRRGCKVAGADVVFAKLWVARHWVTGREAQLVCFDAGSPHWPIPGAPADLIQRSLDSGAEGIVIEGMGAGNIGDELAQAAQAAAKKVPVVLTTRVDHGPVEGIYGGAGGGATLADAGVISSGTLRAPQARMLLAAAITTDTDPAELFPDAD